MFMTFPTFYCFSHNTTITLYILMIILLEMPKWELLLQKPDTLFKATSMYSFAKCWIKFFLVHMFLYKYVTAKSEIFKQRMSVSLGCPVGGTAPSELSTFKMQIHCEDDKIQKKMDKGENFYHPEVISLLIFGACSK